MVVQSGIQIVERKNAYDILNQNSVFGVTTVGNINPIKNLEMVLDVAELTKNENIKFQIVGKVWDSQARYFKKLKSIKDKRNLNNVEFFTNENDVKIFHEKKTNLYFCTSHQESSPLSIWEALSLGIPIVSTNVGDLLYYNNKYNFGFVSTDKSIINFSHLITQLHKDRKKNVTLSKNAYNFAKQEINIEDISKKILDHLLKNI